MRNEHHLTLLAVMSVLFWLSVMAARADISFPPDSVVYPASKFQLFGVLATRVPAPGALNDQTSRLDSKGTWGVQMPVDGSQLKPGYEYKLYAVARVKLTNPQATGNTFGVGIYDYAKRTTVFGAQPLTASEVSEDWRTYECGTWIPASHEQTIWVGTWQGAMDYVEIDRFVAVPCKGEALDSLSGYLKEHPDEMALVARGGMCGWASVDLADAKSLKLECLSSGVHDAALWPNAWMGLVFDYHTPSGRIHRVNCAWRGQFRGTSVLEGDLAQIKPDTVDNVTIGPKDDQNSFAPVDIAANAPADWDGRVRITLMVRGMGTDNAALISIIPKKPWRQLAILDCSSGDLPESALDYGGIWGAQQDELASVFAAQRRRVLVSSVAGKNGGKAPAYLIRVESPQQLVFKNKINDSWLNSTKAVEPVNLHMAKRESESSQIVLIPTGSDPLRKVSVSVSSLTGAGKARIAAGDIKLWRVEYVEVPHPANGQAAGWWPDPLLPNAPVDVPAGENRAVMLTVHTTPQTPAGTYTGTLTIKPENAPATKVPITVTVWNFELPLRNHLKTAFWFSLGSLERYYNYPSGAPTDLLLKYADFLNEYRVGMNFPGGMTDHLDENNRGFKMYREKDGTYSFDFTEMDRLLERCFADGQNTFNIALSSFAAQPWDHMPVIDRATGATEVYTCKGYDDPSFWPIYKSFLTAITAHFEKKGWMQYAYYQGWDEPQENAGHFQGLRKVYDFVHETVPQLKRLVTKEPLPGLEGCVDIWCPLDVYFNLDATKARQKAGEEVWWYVIGNRFNHSLPPMDARMLFWTTWKYNLSGLLYWSTNWWCGKLDDGSYANVQADPAKRWPNSPWQLSYPDFSGQLCYPEPSGPLPSQRIEAIRDGIEDYEYLHVLAEKLHKLRSAGKEPKWAADAEKLLAVPDSVAPDKFTSLQDPVELQRMRARIAEMICSK